MAPPTGNGVRIGEISAGTGVDINNLYRWDESGRWVAVRNIQGPKGKRGDPGPSGAPAASAIFFAQSTSVNGKGVGSVEDIPSLSQLNSTKTNGIVLGDIDLGDPTTTSNCIVLPQGCYMIDFDARISDGTASSEILTRASLYNESTVLTNRFYRQFIPVGSLFPQNTISGQYYFEGSGRVQVKLSVNEANANYSIRVIKID